MTLVITESQHEILWNLLQKNSFDLDKEEKSFLESLKEQLKKEAATLQNSPFALSKDIVLAEANYGDLNFAFMDRKKGRMLDKRLSSEQVATLINYLQQHQKLTQLTTTIQKIEHKLYEDDYGGF